MVKVIEFKGTNAEFKEFLKTLVEKDRPLQIEVYRPHKMKAKSEDIRQLAEDLIKQNEQYLREYQEQDNKMLELYMRGKIESLKLIIGYIDLMEM